MAYPDMPDDPFFRMPRLWPLVLAALVVVALLDLVIRMLS
jgi:hypothetical protein